MFRHPMTVRAGWITARDLTVAVLFGAGLGAIFRRVPMSGLVSTSIVAVAASWWGRHMARLIGLGDERRIAWAVGLAVGPSVMLVGVSLALAETGLVEQSANGGLPIHVVYSLLFVPAAVLIAASGGLGLGFGARDVRLGASLAVWSGISGGLAFLIIDLLMDTLGWRVGGPNAGQRATMLVVSTLGAFGTAFAAGAALGHRLRRFSDT